MKNYNLERNSMQGLAVSRTNPVIKLGFWHTPGQNGRDFHSNFLLRLGILMRSNNRLGIIFKNLCQSFTLFLSKPCEIAKDLD